MTTEAGTSSGWRARAAALRAGVVRALPWVAAGAVAFPISVLLHELGHYGAFVAFGFPEATLHYASATWALSTAFEDRVLFEGLSAAATLAPPWKVGVAAAAGLVMTYAAVAAAVVATRRYGPIPVVVAVGLVAPLRFTSLQWLVRNMIAGRPAIARTDEGVLLAVTSLPPIVPIAAGAICWFLGWALIIRELPASDRWPQLTALLVGLAIGAPLYAGVIGPWLLP